MSNAKKVLLGIAIALIGIALIMVMSYLLNNQVQSWVDEKISALGSSSSSSSSSILNSILWRHKT